MSTFTQFTGGGLKSYQTGHVSSTSASSGTGEDARFVDVTISAVDTAKAFVYFVGGFSNGPNNTTLKSGPTAVYEATARLTSSTNLRISTHVAAPTHMEGRWQVLEFA